VQAFTNKHKHKHKLLGVTMTKALIALIATVTLSSSAFAAILSTTPGSKTIEKIQVANEGTVSVEGQNLPVSIIGAGLRSKKKAMFNVKVYVAELLSSDANKFVRTSDGALNSLELSRTIALRLNFVRGVDAPTVQTSFTEALKANGVNVADQHVAQFLKAVTEGGDAVSGKALTIVSQKYADKTEAVYYEDANGKVTKIHGNEGFSRKLMSIWLGTPSDDGVANLKAQIIQGL
jgi:hypothetical protein